MKKILFVFGFIALSVPFAVFAVTLTPGTSVVTGTASQTGTTSFTTGTTSTTGTSLTTGGSSTIGSAHDILPITNTMVNDSVKECFRMDSGVAGGWIKTKIPCENPKPTPVVEKKPAPIASCTMPINVEGADWSPTVTCLMNRIQILEARIIALEKANTILVPESKPFPSENAKAVQNFLNSSVGAALNVDGKVGAKTSAAIKMFQYAQGLSQTGSLDSSTLEKMKELAPAVAPTVSASLEQIVPVQ